MDDFLTRRRQRFIDESYFYWLSDFHIKSIEEWKYTLPANGSDASKQARAAWFRATGRFELMLLGYTAGEPVQSMRAELTDVVAAYEEYTSLQQTARDDMSWPALLLNELADYERAMQLIGLCHLLHRRELLPRIAKLEDGTYRGQDTLYEDLLAYGMEGRVDVDQWYHEQYRDCINGIYGATDEESLADLDSYLDKWYASMNGVPWHDTHLDLSERGGGYFGYWAIEAAAVAYLRELDDTILRKHIVYPKDLVDFARSFKPEPQPSKADLERQQLRTGQICPQTGIWKAIGHHIPGVRVEQGQVMPEVFAPDKSGAYRMQPVAWEYERPA